MNIMDFDEIFTGYMHTLIGAFMYLQHYVYLFAVTSENLDTIHYHFRWRQYEHIHITWWLIRANLLWAEFGPVCLLLQYDLLETYPFSFWFNSFLWIWKHWKHGVRWKQVLVKKNFVKIVSKSIFNVVSNLCGNIII